MYFSAEVEKPTNVKQKIIMKKALSMSFTLIFALFFFLANGQNISGEWNGIITQESGGIAGQYYFSLHLKQEGKLITGFSKVELYEGDKQIMFARKSLEGIFDGKTLIFKEIDIIEQKMLMTTSLCLTQGKLNLVIDKSALCLKGTWGGKTKENGYCAPGEIKVCSIIPIAVVD